ncbi:putative transcriptional regulator [Pedobacter sp. W3I1]|nr:putative transcriptional regulator [Pedobacter sp. W3I1]
MIKELTKAEEQIMLILWEMGEALVKDVIEKMNEPKPALQYSFHCNQGFGG